MAYINKKMTVTLPDDCKLYMVDDQLNFGIGAGQRSGFGLINPRT